MLKNIKEDRSNKVKVIKLLCFACPADDQIQNTYIGFKIKKSVGAR